jgi:hypothetical protein
MQTAGATLRRSQSTSNRFIQSDASIMLLSDT